MIRSVVLLGLAFALGCTSGCLRPPLQLRVSAEEVTLDLQTLGEYPTAVQRILLSERESGLAVWELEAQSPIPQIWEVSLPLRQSGVPSVRLASGSYRILRPGPGLAIDLRSSVEY